MHPGPRIILFVAQSIVLEGYELIRQDHGHRNTVDIGQKCFLFRVLIYIYNDSCFAVRSSGVDDLTQFVLQNNAPDRRTGDSFLRPKFADVNDLAELEILSSIV